jgi:acyl carrier protein
MPEAESLVVEAITALLTQRGDGAGKISQSTRLQEDLRLDSLELAELSAMLEDELGRDPYTEGLAPRTVGEIVTFYQD